MMEADQPTRPLPIPPTAGSRVGTPVRRVRRLPPRVSLVKAAAVAGVAIAAGVAGVVAGAGLAHSHAAGGHARRAPVTSARAGLPGEIIFMTSAPGAPPRFWRIRQISPAGAGGGLLPIGDALCCSGPALSPDGTKLAFTGEGIMTVTDLHGHPAHGRWSQNPVTSGLGYFADPVWSPSGRQIAFLAVPGGPQGPQLDVINADGTGLRRLIQGRQIQADPGTLAWSPDGTQIAFATTPAGPPVPSGTIAAVGVSGGPTHTIVSGVLGGVTALTWAPGPQPLFTTGHQPGIWEADGHGGATIVLHCPACRDADPSWAPDGIHFTAARPGTGIIVATVKSGVQAIIGPPDVTYVQWGGPPGPPSPPAPRSAPSP